MKFFSDCSNDCVVCGSFGRGCLAGHGDNDFGRASQEQLLNRLNKYQNDLKYINNRYDSYDINKKISLIKSVLFDWYNIQVE